jgi:hypothetical protein
MGLTFPVGKSSSAWGYRRDSGELSVQVVADKVTEGLEIGVAGVLGELLIVIPEAG